MSNIEEEIKKHENIIADLNIKIEDEKDVNQKLLINEKIKIEQNFLLSLLKISTNDENNEKTKKSQNSNKKIYRKISRKKYINAKETKKDISNEMGLKDIDPYNNNWFYYKNDNNKLVIKFLKKLEKGNFIYFECNKRRSRCKGKCK